MNANENGQATTILQRAKHEIKEYAFLCAYLYVCFAAILLYKMAVLGSQGVEFLVFGIPAIKALILGKFILLGHTIGLGERSGSSRLVGVVAYKAALYLSLILVMSLAEECVVGFVHGRALSVVIADIASRLPELLAMSAIMLLILIPYLASRELGVVLGKGRLWSLFFEHREVQ
ncbi:hypothetical protein [Rhizobium laguerreae]|uniref:hypothetical protein n=1 Tax=Rhizobium laguerreae TaxID=1076926 RepID=UPI001C91964B|nr:hypothetical protein [Rhizobium laguerreae]MBY3233780.1 hypothetical protein [Rhizobium laguerreae]MBY3377930.1 hypothetical protein [Rhizobium laguerreae]